jgi:hypothetical protein
VIFERAAGDEESRTALKIVRARFFAPLRMTAARFLAEFTLSTQSEIPSLRSGQALRAVYPERSERAQDDSDGLGMTAKGSE